MSADEDRQQRLETRRVYAGVVLGVAALVAVMAGALRYQRAADDNAVDKYVAQLRASARAEPVRVEPEDAQAADDVANVLRVMHPIACRVASADAGWATCHDEIRGFERILACTVDAQRAIGSAQTMLSHVPLARSSCGRRIEGAIKSSAAAATVFFSDLAAWLRLRAGALRGPLATKSLSDACDLKGLCAGKPERYDSKYEAMGYENVQKVECTKELFQCGTLDNVCWVSKVAARLGVACDPSENRNDVDLLRSRLDGRAIQ